MENQGFLKRMKKERKERKNKRGGGNKQRNSSTNSTSSDSNSIRSPSSNALGSSGTGYGVGGGYEFEYGSQAAASNSYNANISVDSEGYSVRPPDDHTGAGGGGGGSAGGNNRQSAASFYSSSDEDSDDDNGGGGGTKFNSSLGSNLKFSIRPPDINLAPSMDDLSNATRNLTLEKSPRVSRRGINSAGIKNDSSSSLTAMNSPAGGTVPASNDDRCLTKTDTNITGSNFDGAMGNNYRMPDIPGGEMGGGGTVNTDTSYGPTSMTSQAHSDYSYTDSANQSSYSQQQDYGTTLFGASGDTTTSGYYSGSYSAADPSNFSQGSGGGGGYSSSTAAAGAVNNYSYYSSNVQNQSLYNQNVDASSSYVAQAQDSGYNAPNSSEDEDDEDAGYLPPPSMPPPKLPPSMSSPATATPSATSTNYSNTTSATTPNQLPISTATPTANSNMHAQVQSPGDVFSPNDQAPTYPQSYAGVPSTNAANQNGGSSVIAGQVPIYGQKDSSNSDFTASFQPPRERSSSIDSNSSTSMGFNSSGVPVGSSRGPSPLTVGTSESVPIAVAFSETLHAIVYSQQPPSSWQVKVNGTLAVSFPAGFIQLLHQHMSGTKFVDELKFSVLNSGQLTRAVTNSEVIQSSCEGVYESHVEYTFKMDQLRSELLKQQAQKPTASFFNIEVFKYQIDALAYHQNYLPLLLSAQIQSFPCSSDDLAQQRMMTSSSSEEEQPLDDNAANQRQRLYIRAEYNHDCVCNNSSVVAAKPLLNVDVLAKVEGTGGSAVAIDSVQPTPVLNESGKVVWKIGAVSVNSAASDLTVQWSSASQNHENSSSQGVSSAAVAAQFTLEGQLLSGLEFDLVSPGYRVSLYKHKIQTGKYVCHC